MATKVAKPTETKLAVGIFATFLCGYFLGKASGILSFGGGSGPVPGPDGSPNGGPIKGKNFWDNHTCITESYECPEDYKGLVPPTIILSLDGFQDRYLTRNLSPNINGLVKCGVRAEYMRSVYPTRTFPNHFSIATGNWVESHGIIDNQMYNGDRFFSTGNKEAYTSDWWKGEPIWTTAEKQGKKAATFYWPGSDLPNQNITPTYYYKYDGKTMLSTRVDVVVNWLSLPPANRPHLIVYYFEKPDVGGHQCGPNCQQVNDEIVEIDTQINYLLERLQHRGLLGCVNMILVSDHGMIDVNCNKTIVMSDLIDIKKNRVIVGTLSRIQPSKPDEVNSVIEKLRCKKYFRVFHKHMQPKRLHYSGLERIEPITLKSDPGVLFAKEQEDVNFYCGKGNHGWDNLAVELRGMFIAHGPAFKQNYVTKPFHNIEVYNLLSELIGLVPTQNNGTVGALHHILKKPKNAFTENPKNFVPANCFFKPGYTPSFSAGCPCQSEVSVSSKLFGFSVEGQQSTRERHTFHVPWKEPGYATETEIADMCLLTNYDYVTAFHKKLKTPVWTSYTLPDKRDSTVEVDVCWQQDVRLEGADFTCSDYARFRDQLKLVVHREQLFPLAFSSSKEQAGAVWFHSNSFLALDNFTAEVFKEYFRLINTWNKQYGSINVISGPAFDIHGNGKVPSIAEILNTQVNGSNEVHIPSHLFFVVTRCTQRLEKLSSCKAADLDVFAGLLPLTVQEQNCMSMQEFLIDNLCTVTDIELLTGLQFFNGLPVYETIRLRTRLPEIADIPTISKFKRAILPMRRK